MTSRCAGGGEGGGIISRYKNLGPSGQDDSIFVGPFATVTAKTATEPSGEKDTINIAEMIFLLC